MNKLRQNFGFRVAGQIREFGSLPTLPGHFYLEVNEPQGLELKGAPCSATEDHFFSPHDESSDNFKLDRMQF